MDVQKVLADYVKDVTAAELAAESTLVHEHVARVVEAAETRDFVDLKLAKAVGDPGFRSWWADGLAVSGV